MVQTIILKPKNLLEPRIAGSSSLLSEIRDHEFRRPCHGILKYRSPRKSEFDRPNTDARGSLGPSLNLVKKRRGTRYFKEFRILINFFI